MNTFECYMEFFVKRRPTILMAPHSRTRSSLRINEEMTGNHLHDWAAMNNSTDNYKNNNNTE